MILGINGRFLAARATGVQRFALEVSRRLAGDAEVVLLLPADAEAGALGGAARIEMGRLRGHAWEQLELPGLAVRAGCDVVLNLANTGPLRGPSTVLMVHDATPLTHPGWYAPAFAAWYRVAMKGAARRAARVLVPSRWTGEAVVQALGVPADRVDVVTQGVAPFDEPASAADVARMREAYGLPASYLLAMGGTDPRKNVAFLGDVLRRLPVAGRPPLVVVGGATPGVHRSPGPPRDIPGLHALGHVDDETLRALYTGAAAFCFPSLAEGFGRPPLEAMGCGAPAVVADYDVAAEVLGDAALRLPLDAELWAEALEGLLRDEAARRRRSERGRGHALTFEWEDAVAGVRLACERAAAGPAVPV